jgi:hypothetical protein
MDRRCRPICSFWRPVTIRKWELVRRALGEEMVERIAPVWGIGADGELANTYERTPQQGLWFIAGGLAQCRINSKYLALQIKAMQLGKLEPLAATSDLSTV